LTLYEYVQSIRDKRIAVIGAGVSNMPLIRLLSENNCSVTVCDKRTLDALGKVGEELSALHAELKLGEDYLERLDHDLIFRTPGLMPFDEHLVAAKEKGSIVTSEMEVFFRLCPCRTIAVTGSDGKTTTTTVISELLKAEGYTVHLGGNIGRPLLCDVPKMKPADFAVLELSSFKLHSMNCKPNVAVITNVSPNHLDVHPSYEDYIEAKCSIFRRMGECDRLVLNFDNEITASFAARTKAEVYWFSRRQMVDGFYAANGAIYKENERIIDTDEILLPGEHNIENLMAAFCATDGLVSRDTCRKVAREFAGVAHRLELVRTLNGVKYYNDSIASSPTRTIAGLKAHTGDIVLIAGGRDKNLNYDELGLMIREKVSALVLVGETSEKISQSVKKAFGGNVTIPVYHQVEYSMAVKGAYALARGIKKDDNEVSVILSPASTSFDMFKNFEERGNKYKEIVNSLE